MKNKHIEIYIYIYNTYGKIKIMLSLGIKDRVASLMDVAA
jgi:hypothetical protein